MAEIERHMIMHASRATSENCFFKLPFKTMYRTTIDDRNFVDVKSKNHLDGQLTDEDTRKMYPASAIV